MALALETIQDDLRVRHQFSRHFWVEAARFPAMFRRPYTVFVGVLAGDAQMLFAERSRGPVSLSRGDVQIVPAHVRRHTRSRSPSGTELMTAGYFFEIRGGIDLLSLVDLPPRVDRATNSRLFGLLRELWALEAESPRPGTLRESISRQRIGYAMLEAVLSVAEVRDGALAMRAVFPAIEHLNREYQRRPDIPALVEASGLSRTHFFRMFKSQTGTTPVEFVKRRRLREALLLLQHSDLTIAQIGDAVGWPDPFYFSKLFKAAIGMPPTEYRISHRPR